MLRPPPQPQLRQSESQYELSSKGRSSPSGLSSKWKSSTLGRAASALLLRSGVVSAPSNTTDNFQHKKFPQRSASPKSINSNTINEEHQHVQMLLKQEIEHLRVEMERLQQKHQFQLERLRNDCEEAETEAAQAREELARVRKEFAEYKSNNRHLVLEMAEQFKTRECSDDAGQEQERKTSVVVDRQLDALESKLKKLEAAVGIVSETTVEETVVEVKTEESVVEPEGATDTLPLLDAADEMSQKDSNDLNDGEEKYSNSKVETQDCKEFNTEAPIDEEWKSDFMDLLNRL